LPDFFGTTYQNGEKYTKFPQNIPNGYKNIPNEHKIYQIVCAKALQNTPKVGFGKEIVASGNPGLVGIKCIKWNVTSGFVNR
jgi:hypothetical protein